MSHRLPILILNLFFPPLAVAIMTGLASPETIVNVLLFFLGVIPSIIHGLFICYRTFSRDENLERHQWEGVEPQPRPSSSSSSRRAHRQRTHSRSQSRSRSGRPSISGSSNLSGSTARHSKRDVYEVEEYSDTDYKLAAADGRNGSYDRRRPYAHPQAQPRPAQLYPAHPYPVYRISDVAPPPPPPPCPEPPAAATGLRYIQ